jgi:RNA polymerase sigma factor (sigma-70 family)
LGHFIDALTWSLCASMDVHELDTEVDPELDELVEQFGHRVRYFAFRVERRFGLGPQWRDDLISSGYWGLLKALRNRRSDAHPHELSAYVSRRVEGAVFDEARRVLSRLANHSDCDPDDFEAGLPNEMRSPDWESNRHAPGPEELADQQGRWRSIERAIDHLGPDHRSLLLAYASGRSIAEIARSDGSSPARLQNQLSKISRGIRARSPELRRLLRHEI